MNNTQKNQFHRMGDTYRRAAAKSDPAVFDQAAMFRTAQLYEILGDMCNVDQNAARFVMDTGTLNEEMLAYASLAAWRCGFDPETVQTIRDKMRFYFDEMTAAEAMKEWHVLEGTTYIPPEEEEE